MNIKQIYENAKARKAVDDPRVRQGDPPDWSSLSDVQRDTINTWYMDLLIRDLEEEKAQSNHNDACNFFALVPFAIAHAYHSTKGALTFSFLVSAIAAWLVYAFIFYIFRMCYDAYEKARSKGRKQSIIEKVLSKALAVFVAFFVTLVVLNRIYG